MVKEEKKPPHGPREGAGAEEASHPSTCRSETDKSRVETEVRKHEKEEVVKTEVMTYASMDTPSGIEDAVGARFALSRQESEYRSEEEECAGHGNSDGAGGVVPCAIPDRLTLRQMTLPVTNTMARNEEEKASAKQPSRGDAYRRIIEVGGREGRKSQV